MRTVTFERCAFGGGCRVPRQADGPLQHDAGGLHRARGGGDREQAPPRRAAVEVRRRLLLRHGGAGHDRLRPLDARHGGRQGLLHGVRHGGHPPVAGHVPEHRRASQQVRVRGEYYGLCPAG